MTNSKMRAAYGAAGRIIQEKQSAEEQQLFDDISRDDIMVVRGQYDQVENVLEVMDLPHTAIDANELARLTLRSDQMLVINCPGTIDQTSIEQVREFVRSGGSLFTTDWALKNVLEPSFPGVVRFNEQTTSDTVVAVDQSASDNPMLDGIFDENADPQWWLEQSSYPIEILNRGQVKVLVDSSELGRRWGESPVVISFEYGFGEVLHMISHYYLQRTELRTKRHSTSWTNYAYEKNAEESANDAPKAYNRLNVGEVEAAYSSAKLLLNSVHEYKRRAPKNAQRDSESAEQIQRN